LGFLQSKNDILACKASPNQIAVNHHDFSYINFKMIALLNAKNYI